MSTRSRDQRQAYGVAGLVAAGLIAAVLVYDAPVAERAMPLLTAPATAPTTGTWSGADQPATSPRPPRTPPVIVTCEDAWTWETLDDLRPAVCGPEESPLEDDIVLASS